jgi:hypothetical protein
VEALLVIGSQLQVTLARSDSHSQSVLVQVGPRHESEYAPGTVVGAPWQHVSEPDSQRPSLTPDQVRHPLDVLAAVFSVTSEFDAVVLAIVRRLFPDRGSSDLSISPERMAVAQVVAPLILDGRTLARVYRNSLASRTRAQMVTMVAACGTIMPPGDFVELAFKNIGSALAAMKSGGLER